MDIEAILNHRPKLTDGPLVTPQPSIEDIVQEHYARLAGNAEGRELASAYIARIDEYAGSSVAAPEPAAAQPSAPAVDVSGHRAAPDKTPARTLVRAMVDAAVRSSGPATRLQLQRDLQRWRQDERLVSIYPALAMTDAEGGLSVHDESQMSMRSILKGLVADKVLAYDGSRYTLAGAQDEAHHAATGRDESARPEEAADASRPEERTQPEADPFAGIREALKDVGFDMKVGDVDLSGGISRISKGGSAIPLMTGLAGILIGAIATAESRRPKD